jgi:dTDP-glucose pyrophosphorylase
MLKRIKSLSAVISKNLMSINHKPMILYSLSVLIYSKVKNILLIADLDLQKYFSRQFYL